MSTAPRLTRKSRPSAQSPTSPQARPDNFLSDRLVEAFKYRNGSDDEKANSKITNLAAALVQPGLETFYPKFIVRMK